MAGLGRKVFAASEILTAANVQNYLMDQTVMIFNDTTDRSTVLGTAVSEGMVTYLNNSNSLEVYNGSAWTPMLTSGTITGTQGYTAISNGQNGVTYQPVSPNYIINGAFDFWQRGTSFSNPATGTYTADRWQFGRSTASPTATVSRVAFTPADIEANGFGDATHYLRLAVTTLNGATNIELRNHIEDVRTLSGQTVTFSFWAKASSSRQILAYLAQDWKGSSINYAQENVTIGTTWQRYSITKTLTSASGKTIGANSFLQAVLRDTNATDGSTFDIWGVQLEAGSVATPFRRNANSLQGELAACQRYYYRMTPAAALDPLTYGAAHTTTAARSVIYFPVEMRIKPTALEQSGTAGDYQVGQAGIGAVTLNAVPTFSAASTRLATINATVASGLTQFVPVTINAVNTNGYLGWSAEL